MDGIDELATYMDGNMGFISDTKAERLKLLQMIDDYLRKKHGLIPYLYPKTMVLYLTDKPDLNKYFYYLRVGFYNNGCLSSLKFSFNRNMGYPFKSKSFSLRKIMKDTEKMKEKIDNAIKELKNMKIETRKNPVIDELLYNMFKNLNTKELKEVYKEYFKRYVVNYTVFIPEGDEEMNMRMKLASLIIAFIEKFNWEYVYTQEYYTFIFTPKIKERTFLSVINAPYIRANLWRPFVYSFYVHAKWISKPIGIPNSIFVQNDFKKLESILKRYKGEEQLRL